jgi:hypothetical protein
MSQRELFSVPIKSVGVLQFVEAVVILPQLVRMISLGVPAQASEVLWAFVVPSTRIVAACLLFVSANWLATKTYGAKPDQQH